nr:NADH dehydrogenase subunit 6 [Amblyomma sp.]BCW91257.1 NADH dehydrogenase subunit 6 [Amblyomma sp.]BCW91270.1 NADH dehydrogenase subunit 6 [Amblyomma sp.]BCW91283.1 NADH dehydrogenase subunit 6 [Amblyomma sp.]BCW91296.1 NADH dehydrogenase subunit 6 [Amblyomma sp.]
MKIITFLSVLLISMSHPMSMLISVIILTILMAMIFYQNSCNSLFSLMLILLILGGMLIIFMYMVSLCPNKKINFNFKTLVFFSMTTILNFNYIFNKFNYQELIKIYSFPFMNMLIIMMIYLLITLMVTMKLLNWISSPLKSF